MSLIEEALKRAKRDAPGTGPSRSRVEPAHAPATRNGEATAPMRLAAIVATRPVLTVGREQLRSEGLAPLGSAERRLTSEYRAIKRALLAAMARSNAAQPGYGNSVMVASAMPGEGKTFTSINLALSLAQERDWTVVLIDADSAKRQLSNVLGVSHERGLLDALTNPNCSLADVMFRSSVPGLHFVPAGQSSEPSTELMASARMGQLLAELYRDEPRIIVVFDSSPILLTTESRALADVAGQVLLVVRADLTPRASVQEAIAALGEGHNVGLVLNEYQGTALQQSYYEGNDGPRALETA